MVFQNLFLEQLQQLEQTSTIDEYHQRFEAIRDLVSYTQPGISEDYFAYQFINGLRADYHHYVQMFEPFNVIDAYELACIYEYSFCSFDNASVISIVSDGNNFGLPYDDIADTIEAKQMVEDTTELGEVDFHIEIPEQAPKEILQNSLVVPIQSDAFEKEQEHRTALLAGDDIQCAGAYSPTVVNNSSPIFGDNVVVSTLDVDNKDDNAECCEFLTSVALSVIVTEGQNGVAPRDSASAIFLVNGLFSGEFSVCDPIVSRALVPPRKILLKNAVLSSGHTTIMGKGGTAGLCRQCLASVNVVGNQFALHNGSDFGTAAIDGDVVEATSSIVASIVDFRVINVERAASTHIPRPLILLIVRSPLQNQHNLHTASTGNVSIQSDRVTNMVVHTHASFVSELVRSLSHIIVAICVDLNGAQSDIAVQLHASFGFKGGTCTLYISYFPELPCSSHCSFTTKERLLCSTIGTCTSIQISGFLHSTICAHMPTRAAEIEWDGVQLCSGPMISSVTVSSSVLSDGFMCIALAIILMHYKAISVWEATLQAVTSSQLQFVLITNFGQREPTICSMPTQESTDILCYAPICHHLSFMCILCCDLVIECDVLIDLDIFFLSIGNMAIVVSSEHFHLALQGHLISRRTNFHGCTLRSIICFSPVLYWLTAEKTTWVPGNGFRIKLFVYPSASSIHLVTSSTTDTTALVYHTGDDVSMSLVCTEQIVVVTFSYLRKDPSARENIAYVVQFYYPNRILDKGGTHAASTATSVVDAPFVKGSIASASQNLDDTTQYAIQNKFLLAAQLTKLTSGVKGYCMQQVLRAILVKMSPVKLKGRVHSTKFRSLDFMVHTLLWCKNLVQDAALQLLQRNCNVTINGVIILCSLSARSLLLQVPSRSHTWVAIPGIILGYQFGLLWSPVTIPLRFALDLNAIFSSLLLHNSGTSVAFLWIIAWLVARAIWPVLVLLPTCVGGEHYGLISFLFLP